MSRCASCICYDCHPARQLDQCRCRPRASAEAEEAAPAPAAAPAAGAGSSTDGGARAPPEVFKKLEDLDTHLLMVNSKVDDLLKFAKRFGPHLDQITDQLGLLDEKVDKAYSYAWHGQYNLEKQVEGVNREVTQVRTGVTEVIEEVSNVFHNVTQVRTAVVTAISEGNADREQAFYRAAAIVGNHADGEEWGPWNKQINAPEAAAESREAAAESGASTTAMLDQEYIVTQIDEAEVLNIQNIDMASAAAATNGAS